MGVELKIILKSGGKEIVIEFHTLHYPGRIMVVIKISSAQREIVVPTVFFDGNELSAISGHCIIVPVRIQIVGKRPCAVSQTISRAKRGEDAQLSDGIIKPFL